MINKKPRGAADSLKPFLLLILVFSAAAFTGCKTLPLPDSPDDGLVIFPASIEKNWLGNNKDPFRLDRAYLKIKRRDQTRISDTEYSVEITPSRGFGSIALPEGEYVITHIILSHSNERNHSWQDKQYVSGSFFIKAGTIYLFRRTVYFRPRQPDGYRFQLQPGVSQSLIEDIQASMLKDRFWPGWEGYQMVNFD